MTDVLTRRSIFAQAWPIMLGQTTVPLVGLVDTAVIGHTGDAAALAGVALGTTIINLIFWTFGFLRMGMTGMTAQAEGAADAAEVEAMLLRGLALGVGLGLALFALQIALIPLAFALLAGGARLDAAAQGYVAARFLGAPASLAVFAINGWLLGLGRTRAALVLQIVMNLVNIGLNVLFVWHYGMGARGVGLGTACAEWTALVVGLLIAGRYTGGLAVLGRLRDQRLFARDAMRRLFAVNADIMIRTIALLLMFTWFTNAGARLGETTLAANQVLMQFVSVAAFVLDGFAFTAESRIGQAIGSGSAEAMRRAIRLTGEFCLAAGVAFALIFWAAGRPFIDLLTTNYEVRATAAALLPFAAIVPAIGAPAWLLDGIFIGATRGRALRNAAILATAAYVATDLLLRPAGVWGVWLALVLSYLYRAVALGAFLPGLLRSVALAKAAP
ncbi:MATE family multidrug resistance protein [Hephaestia caeni]|uniref:MATE family multidrug resistance protein n=1 Tax=Hephaestia caeni TaxID=645617 RepID=A0A397NWW4_9SPHN|nr:MATE family efflux transporter [Hephaestia caeni]RIA37901.1 MATE family multidrug resistance protein [Hephaestia caeni]